MTWLGDLFKWVGYHLINIGCHIADGMSLDEYVIDQEVNAFMDLNREY